jgi:hypothetical protein
MRGVVHNLINLDKAICQDEKDFNKEIKRMRYDLMLNEYQQEFITSILNPSRSSHHSSQATYQSTVIIPYVALRNLNNGN